MMHANINRLIEQMKPLTGATILRISVLEDRGPFGLEHWPRLYVRTPEGEEFTLEIGADPEGNGPGHIFGLPQPEEK